MRVDGGMDKGEGGKWSDYPYTLKLEPIRVSDELDVTEKYKKVIKDDFKILDKTLKELLISL